MQSILEEKKWKEIIRSGNNIFSLNLKEIWHYRDLLFILVRRDILAIYKQTILGPLWFFLQPILTTIVFIIVFSRAAKLSTSELPAPLFYLSGLILWGYFSECILRTSTFFKDNTQILSKVYFPRLIIPLSLIITNLIKLSIQLLLFFIVYAYFYFFTNPTFKPNLYSLMLPVLIFFSGILGLAAGMMVSSLTTRYKDLVHLVTFGVQLLMFTSPVIFPLSNLSESKYKYFVMLNPMTGIIEAFRYGFFGKGDFSWWLLSYDMLFAVILLLAAIMVFNLVEKSFVDTI